MLRAEGFRVQGLGFRMSTTVYWALLGLDSFFSTV